MHVVLERSHILLTRLAKIDCVGYSFSRITCWSLLLIAGRFVMFERPRLLLWEDTASDILLLDLSPAIVSPLPPFCFFNTLFKLVFGTDSVLLSQSTNIFYHHDILDTHSTVENGKKNLNLSITYLTVSPLNHSILYFE